MRIVRFRHKKTKQAWGIYEKDKVRVLQSAPFNKLRLTGRCVAYKDIKLLPPTIASKIILVGLNYKDHAKELGMTVPEAPIIFLKPPTALIGHKENIVYPGSVKRLDYEAELALIIKKDAKNIPEEKAWEYILGYTCLNDVTARDIQREDIQWSRSKSFDTFCPLGPWIETEPYPSNLRISSYLNGQVRQSSSTSNFIFPVQFLVSFISGIMSLTPGDVISTGTPPGVGQMHAGDTIEIRIEGIGSLINRVVLP